MRFIPRQKSEIEKGEIRALLGSLIGDAMINGPDIERFENSFAEFIGMDKAFSCASARGALNLILDCLDLKKGDEIIVPSFTFYIVPVVIAQKGLTPIFVDSESDGFNMDVGKFKKAITGKTKAVVATHLFGDACEMGEIMEIARDKNIFVIEDCAHSLGAMSGGRRAGSFGDAAFFSFSAGKTIDTVEGGIIVSGNKAVIKKLDENRKKMKFPSALWLAGKFLKKYLLRIGMNSVFINLAVYPVLSVLSFFSAKDIVYEALKEKREKAIDFSGRLWNGYTNFQAGLALKQLAKVDKRIEKRGMIAKRYRGALKEKNEIEILAGKDGGAYYQFVVKTKERDAIYKKLLRGGIDVQKCYCENCGGISLLKKHGENRDCKRTKELEKDVLHISLRWNLSEKEISHTVKQISKL